MNAIEIVGLKKSYPGFALSVPTFVAPVGHIMGLVGPNGAGKTTLIKLIMGLVNPDAGEIRVYGRECRSDGAQARAHIGFVPDTPQYYGYLSLARHRSLIAPFYPGWDEDTFQRLVTRFQLPLNRKFGALSRGMRMKFSLTLALSHNADLLLMDEPTTGLDPVFRRDFLDHLAEVLQDEHKSVLFSTHITSDLDRITDYVTYLQDGAVRFSCTRDEIRDTWAIATGGTGMLNSDTRRLFAAVEEGAYGFRALAFDAAEARRGLPQEAIFEKPTIEEVVVLLTGSKRDTDAATDTP